VRAGHDTLCPAPQCNTYAILPLDALDLLAQRPAMAIPNAFCLLPPRSAGLAPICRTLRAVTRSTPHDLHARCALLRVANSLAA